MCTNKILKAKIKYFQLIGVSFHVGSGCGDPPVFRRAISAARTLFDYAKTLGYRFDLLDIGGGYPGNSGTSINAVSKMTIYIFNSSFSLTILLNYDY